MDVIIKGFVKHNGKEYRTGDKLKRIKSEDGERLIVLGVAIIDEESEKEAARKKAEEEAKLAAEKAKKEAEEKAKSEAKKETEKK